MSLPCKLPGIVNRRTLADISPSFRQIGVSDEKYVENFREYKLHNNCSYIYFHIFICKVYSRDYNKVNPFTVEYTDDTTDTFDFREKWDSRVGKRKILLYIINAFFMLCNFILIYLSYFNDDTGYYLVMLYVLLIQGGVTGILIKHVLISRSDTSIFDGTLVMYVLNSIFVVLDIFSLLVYYFMF